jgi:ABC-2 type transport system permease protein
MDYIGYIASLPESMRTAMGMGNLDIASMAFTADTYIAIEFLMFWPLIVCFYSIFTGVNISREAERGTLDLLLAQPVSRTRVLLSKYAVPIFGILLIGIFSWLGLAVSAPLANIELNLWNQALAILHGMLLVAAICSYTLLISVIFLEPRKALAISGVITAAMYILNFIVPLLNPGSEWLANISFFHHYNAIEIARTGNTDWAALIIYGATFIICSLASIIIFRRRDLNS